MLNLFKYRIFLICILLSCFALQGLAGALPAEAQTFIRKGQSQTTVPRVTIPERGDFFKGAAFEFIPPAKALNGMSLEVWEKVKESEQKRPTFYDDDLDIASMEVARQWQRLYNLAINQDLKTKLKYVNNFFNQWPAGLDEKIWGQEDYWAQPWEFMAYGGDCEDYAIAKFYALKTLGVPAENLCLMVADDFKAMLTHVVLVVIAHNGRDFYVLDNVTNEIYRNGAASKLVPRYFINERNVWRP